MPQVWILPKNADPTSKPTELINKRLVQQLVDKGQAIWLTKNVLAQRTVLTPRSGGIKSRDGYLERIGELKNIHAVMIQGGLTRTESQPKPFSRARGARVGH